MKMNYVRGGIMALLLKGVSRSENRMGMGPMGKVWSVNIGGDCIGYIGNDGLSRVYLAISSGGREVECGNFMQALAQFIDTAITQVEKQGCIERRYANKIGMIEYSNFCFEVEEVRYDTMDEVYEYVLRGEEVIKSYNGTKVINNRSFITPFELRYQQLMGWIVME